MPRRVDLRAALGAHAAADDDERRHLAAMQALLAEPGDVFSRRHYLPGHFTASAFVTTRARDALLLVLHKKLGIWVQPGGHVEPEDGSLQAAAAREALEETLVQAP